MSKSLLSKAVELYRRELYIWRSTRTDAPICVECGSELYADEVYRCFDCYRVSNV